LTRDTGCPKTRIRVPCSIRVSSVAKEPFSFRPFSFLPLVPALGAVLRVLIASCSVPFADGIIAAFQRLSTGVNFRWYRRGASVCRHASCGGELCCALPKRDLCRIPEKCRNALSANDLGVSGTLPAASHKPRKIREKTPLAHSTAGNPVVSLIIRSGPHNGWSDRL
jgi:hypothetical protein